MQWPKREYTNRQTTVDTTIHRKLKIKQYYPHKENHSMLITMWNALFICVYIYIYIYHTKREYNVRNRKKK
jgi:hypothetical protein